MPPPTKYGPNTPASPVAPAPTPVAPAPTPVAPAPTPVAPIQHRPAIVRSTPQGLVASLADQLPLGYKNEAQAAASAYRKLNPKLNWPSDISHRALNRQVPVNYVSEFDDPSTNGQYQPATDQISLRAGLKPKAMGTTLQHELTHATQFQGKIPVQRSSTTQPMLQKTMESQNYDPATARSYSSYMTDPTEQEAFLAGLKRNHYVQTGKHIRTKDEARKMLMDLPNTPENKDQEASIGTLLRAPQINNTPEGAAARAQWIESLSKMLPGLVQGNSLTLGKTANFPGGNAMMPQAAPNGFNPNVFSHNNFSGTFPMGQALPAKPNPLSAAPQMGGVKADANGIQAAMAKRGSQDNSAPRCSSAGESKGVGYKMDDEGHTTGGSAFSTLDKYMKKAGLNSFQTQFFGRLIQSGMNEAQLHHAVKQAQIQFGEKVASELVDGLEKLAVTPFSGAGRLAREFGTNLLNTGTRYAGNAINGIGGFARGLVGKKVAPGASEIGAMAQQAGRKAKTLGRKYVINQDVGTGMATGVFNPYTSTLYDEQGNLDLATTARNAALGGLAGGVVKQTPLRWNARQRQEQMMAGSGIGLAGGHLANALGADVDPTRVAQIGGAAGLLPRNIRGRNMSKVMPKFDPTDIGAQAKNVRAAGRYARDAAKNAPEGSLAKATMIGGGLGLGVGMPMATYAGLSQMGTNAGNAAMQQPEVQSTLKRLNATQQQVQQVADKVNRFAAPFQDDKGQFDLMGGLRRQLGLGEGGTGLGAVGDYLRQNPQLASAGLLSLLGMGTGYMAGGGRGAALGGLSAPLLNYLVQSQLGGNAAPDIAGTNQAAASAAPATPGVGEFDRNRENEIVQQQLGYSPN